MAEPPVRWYYQRRYRPGCRSFLPAESSTPLPKKMTHPTLSASGSRKPWLVLAAAAAMVPGASAQVAPSAPAAADQPVQLSPFEVTTTQDSGYVATNTLAGSRLNTKLADTPAAISVFTRDFLDDIDATTSTDVLAYALNGSRDYSDYTGLSSVQQADALIELRGIRASMYRDYFTWGGTYAAALDTFNTQRVDFVRGPNAILYGVGAVGGAVNTTTKQAMLGQTQATGVFRVGSWDDYRGTIDVNGSAGDTFAVRVNAVDEKKAAWRDFQSYEIQAAAIAATYRPFSHTTIRGEFEYDNRYADVAMPWPSADYISNWLNGGKQISSNDSTVVNGTQLNTARYLVYDPLSGGGLQSWYNTQLTVRTPSAASISYGKSLTDFSIVPKSANLFGPGTTSNSYFNTSSVFIDQDLGPVSAQLSYAHQRSSRFVNYAVDGNDLGVYADANALLPNGQPNPNVGKLYVIGDPNIRYTFQEGDALRGSLAYKLDLGSHASGWLSKVLGVHQLSAMVSREKFDNWTYGETLVNTTPPGSTLYPALESNVNNRIYEKTYLNFGSPNLAGRGAFNPGSYPIINQTGSYAAVGTTAGGSFPVTAGYEQIADASMYTTTITYSGEVAEQSSFLDDRLIVTGGVRNDAQSIYGSGGATSNPVTGIFTKEIPYQNENVFSGYTRSVGGLIRPLPWLGFFYNNSDNFSPQNLSDPTNRAPLGPSIGQDQDFGAKIDLWGGRISATITHYQVGNVNQSTGSTVPIATIAPVINDIWYTLGQAQNVLSTTGFHDTMDTTGRGWELDLQANLTHHWRLMLNASQDILHATNSLPRYRTYIAQNAATWQKNAGTVLTQIGGFTNATLGKSTIGDAQADLNTILVSQFANGLIPLQHEEYALNGFTAYTFGKESGPWLDGLTVGGGLNYTARPIIGYNTNDPTAPAYYGAANVTVSALLARQWQWGKHRIKLQLNIANLFDNENLLPTYKDNTGTYRYNFQNPRSWSLTTSLMY